MKPKDKIVGMSLLSLRSPSRKNRHSTKLMIPNGQAITNAAPYTQTIPAKENQMAKRKEMSAIQSFFVLCITEIIRKSNVLFYHKKSGESPTAFHFFILLISLKNQSFQMDQHISRILRRLRDRVQRLLLSTLCRFCVHILQFQQLCSNQFSC